MSRTIELFKIVSDGVVYNLTSAAKAQTYNSETYEPATIGRAGIQTKNELSKANLDVRLSLDHALAIALLGRWAESITSLTIFAKRTSGTDVIWKGRLANVVPEDASIRMVFESIFTSMRRPGLRARFLKSCRHPLYGRGCYLNHADFAVPGTVTGISGLTVVCPAADALADGYFTGGMLEAPDGTLSYITNHVSSALTMNRISSALATAFADEGPGLEITLYPGCDHSYATCRDKFSNDDNYGGFDYIPTKNPMGGSSIV